jgi:hypothetical protein
MQQDLEDEKNEATIKDLENKVENYEAVLKEKDFVIQDLEIKVKDHEAALEKKNFVIHSMEGSLAEAQAENNKLNNELLIKSEKSKQEKKNLETSLKTKIEKNSNLQKSLKELQEKCLDFGSRCVQRLKDVAGHADFCALLASRGTATAFLKAGCTHGKIVNRPNFSLSPTDLVDIPSLARSIGNRFMTQIWINGGRKMAGDEAQSHLKPVRNLYLLLLPSP